MITPALGAGDRARGRFGQLKREGRLRQVEFMPALGAFHPSFHEWVIPYIVIISLYICLFNGSLT